MDVYELVWRTEQHDAYTSLERTNLGNLERFSNNLIRVAIELERPLISTAIIKTFNGIAVACLHTTAGEYRHFPVDVGDHLSEEKSREGQLPAHWRVQSLMDDLVNVVNRKWDSSNSVELAAYVLWRLNFIHPFRNGNGRTARELAYFVLSVKMGGILPGKKTIPSLIKETYRVYIEALKKADAAFIKSRKEDTEALKNYLEDLLEIQLLNRI